MKKPHFMPGGARGKCPAYDGYGKAIAAGGASQFTSPNSVAAQITGDIDMDAKVVLPSWGGTAIIIGKDNNSTIREYGLHFISGTVRFFYTPDGTTARSADATVNVTTIPAIFQPGVPMWIRVTYASATGAVVHYYSTDGVTWNTLGAGATTTAGAIFASTALLGVGGNSSTSWDVTVYRARIYSGFRQSGGVLKVDFDPTRWTTGNTCTMATGEVWTANGHASFRYT